jgi:hypothetical protein
MAKLYVKLPIRTFARVFQQFPDRDVEVAKGEIGADLIRELPPGHYRVEICRNDEDGIEFTMAEQDGEISDDYPVYVVTMFGFTPRDDVDVPA